MSEHPEFGRLDSLDIYTDENRDGNSINYYIILKQKFYAKRRCFCILNVHSFRRKAHNVVKKNVVDFLEQVSILFMS